MTYNYDAFRQRLKAALKGESINSFAKRCGFAESGLRKYFKEDSLPGTDRLVIISEVAEVNIKWLATGDGPMRPDDKGGIPLDSSPLNETCAPAAPAQRESTIENIQVPAEEFKISEMITKTVEVLESNSIYRTALASNINAFHHSINMIAQIERMEGAMVRMEIEQQQTQSRTTVLEQQVAELLGELKDTEGKGSQKEKKDAQETKKVANG